MTQVFADIKYALRALVNNPGFAAAAILCLALGIGANTAIFTVINAVVMRPLPYAEPERLVRLYTEFPRFPNGGLKKFATSPPEFQDLRRELASWKSLDAWSTGGLNLNGASEPVRITGAFVTGGLLETLGVRPAIGRVITPQDDAKGAPLVAVISSGLWRRAFGGVPGIAGKEVRIEGTPCTIIGVMPDGFQFPPGETDPAEIWIPQQLGPNDFSDQRRGNHRLSLLGRLSDGRSIEQARGELSRIVYQYGSTAAQGRHVFHPDDHPLTAYPLHEEVVASVRPAMVMLMVAVGFVLLIACVNVGNLLLARAEARQKEIAVRTALGASSLLLVRQYLTEAILLALGGAAAGVLLALGGLRLLLAAGQSSIPRANEIGLDARVLLFTLAVSVISGILFGLAPLVQLHSGDTAGTLKAAGGRNTSSAKSNRLRGAMAAAQLALALVLLIGSGLMMRAFWKLQAVNIGLRPAGVLTMRIALPRTVYVENESVRQFWSRLVERVSVLPGVQSASVMAGVPPIRPGNFNDTQIEGFVARQNGPVQNVDYWQSVSPNWFDTVGARLQDGRFLTESDGASANAVVVINETMARTFWPGDTAIGKRIRPGFTDPWRTVVGVVSDIKNAGIDRPAGTELYLPIAQTGAFVPRNLYLALRTQGNPMAMLPAVRRVVADLDPSLPVGNVRTLDDVISEAQSTPRFLTRLVGLFSFTALALAAIGIYGVMSYTVAQRTNEFGVRMAIGAQPVDVLRMVVGQGFRLASIGIAIGFGGALVLTRFLKSFLFGVEAIDPLTFVAMAALLSAIALFACWVPARRATLVDPLRALRYE